MSTETKAAWSLDFDMDTIPDEVFWSHVQRRRAQMRTSYTGGIFWKEHNPDTPRCRCKACMKRRAKAKKV